MSLDDDDTRAAWAPLTHDSLNAELAGKSTLSASQFVLLNFALLLGNVLVLFNTGAFASISLHATGELGVSPSHASWIQTYYFISLAVALPVSAWLAARFGEVRWYLIAMLAMALGSLLCSLTHDLAWFLLGRALQGFFGGLTIPLSQTLLLREYPEPKKAFGISLWSMAALSPFTLGPLLGGWIADNLGWHWLFYLNVPLPLLSAALVWALLFDRVSVRSLRPFDTMGFALLAIALACLQTALNQGQDEDWYNSAFIVSLAIAGVLALVYFIIWELGERYPLLNLRLFARRNFAIGTIGLSVGFLLMYGLLSVLLVRLQSVSGYTSFLAGAVLVPLLFFAKPMAGFFHLIAHRYDARLLACLNMLSFALFCYMTSTYDFFQRNSWFTHTLWSQVLEGFCLGGLFVPMTTLFLSGLNAKRQTQAVELGGILRILGGSAASPLLGVLWERRTAFHQSHIVQTLGTYDALGREALTGLDAAGFHGQLTIARLAQTATQHAAILGLDDAFRLSAWIFLGLATWVWFAYPVKPITKMGKKERLREDVLESLLEEP